MVVQVGAPGSLSYPDTRAILVALKACPGVYASYTSTALHHRGLARSWNTWREAVAASQRATKAARANAQRILRPLLRDTFYAWLDWHDVRLQKE